MAYPTRAALLTHQMALFSKAGITPPAGLLAQMSLALTANPNGTIRAGAHQVAYGTILGSGSSEAKPAATNSNARAGENTLGLASLGQFGATPTTSFAGEQPSATPAAPDAANPDAAGNPSAPPAMAGFAPGSEDAPGPNSPANTLKIEQAGLDTKTPDADADSKPKPSPGSRLDGLSGFEAKIAQHLMALGLPLDAAIDKAAQVASKIDNFWGESDRHRHDHARLGNHFTSHVKNPHMSADHMADTVRTKENEHLAGAANLHPKAAPQGPTSMG